MGQNVLYKNLSILAQKHNEISSHGLLNWNWAIIATPSSYYNPAVCKSMDVMFLQRIQKSFLLTISLTFCLERFVHLIRIDTQTNKVITLQASLSDLRVRFSVCMIMQQNIMYKKNITIWIFNSFLCYCFTQFCQESWSNSTWHFKADLNLAGVLSGASCCKNVITCHSCKLS